MSEFVYQRAVDALIGKCGELADRDRIKVVQLFDRLLDRGHSIHVDDLRRICKDAGYSQETANEIGTLYDDLDLVRKLKNGHTTDYWPLERLERILSDPDLTCQ